MNAAANTAVTTLQSAGAAVRAGQTSFALCTGLLGCQYFGYQGWLGTR